MDKPPYKLAISLEAYRVDTLLNELAAAELAAARAYLDHIRTYGAKPNSDELPLWEAYWNAREKAHA